MMSVKVFGYTDKISVRAGETVNVHVSAEGAQAAQAQLVRLIHGDQNPAGPGFVEEEVACEANGTWLVSEQRTQVGSFLTVADPGAKLALSGSFSLFAFIFPNWPASGQRQSILSRWDRRKQTGYRLAIDATGHLELAVGRGEGVTKHVRSNVTLQMQVWYFVVARFDATTGCLSLHQDSLIGRYNSLVGKVALIATRARISEAGGFPPVNATETPFIVAGASDSDVARGQFVAETYWGKIDRCGVFDRPLTDAEIAGLQGGAEPPSQGLIAFWNTALGYTDRGIGDEVIDTGPFGLNAVGHNRPVRGRTGWNWDGRVDCFRSAPEQFGGIEFHGDALTDCNWLVTRQVALPKTLRSGCYAFRLRVDDQGGLGEDHVVFFVRPAVPRAKLAVVFPTTTYLAYGNERLSFDDPERQAVVGQPPVLSDADMEMYARQDFGLSTYDLHADGRGVCYSSYHRPLLTMRPKSRMPSTNLPSGFAADLSIVAWLEHAGYDYDVLTDEDLHVEGAAALAPYTCVMSGTRPEYVSERMLDATEDYIAGGGRYIYIGGFGFNSTAGIRDSEPWIMECRRRDDGYKTWAARYGEHYLASDGIRGGPWKVLGRASQKMVGVGLSAQGAGRSEFYRRMPDSYHRTVSWITKGIDGEILGESGLADGGAAGIALDAYDLNLGTPPHAKIIASSGGHTDTYVVNQQLVLYAYLGLYGSHDWRVHADMTYFTAPNDGAVFSCGSTAFAQALPVNNFDNNASKLLANVLGAFLKPGALPGRAWISEEKQWA